MGYDPKGCYFESGELKLNVGMSNLGPAHTELVPMLRINTKQHFICIKAERILYNIRKYNENAKRPRRF